jgi:aspartate aminotransferase-like enzyme
MTSATATLPVNGMPSLVGSQQRAAAAGGPALILTPGPVMMAPDILRIGGIQAPYFRNAGFSAIHQGIETLLLQAVRAPAGSRVVLFAGSGTAAMEAAVLNATHDGDAVLVVNGGTFGQRFADIARLHGCAVTEVPGNGLPRPLDGFDGQAVPRAVLLNAHETSVGHRHDLHASGAFCRRLGCLHVVDAISAFGADEIDMAAQSIDVLVLSSNKALGLQPGLAMVVLSPGALAARNTRPRSLYFDFGPMLADGLRGQTPFTPPVTVMLQLHRQLQNWMERGMPALWAHAAALAGTFRSGLAALGLRQHGACPSNFMTAVDVAGVGLSARHIVERLEREHAIVVAPNGGGWADRLFRVAHVGHVTEGDMRRLLLALEHIVHGSRR